MTDDCNNHGRETVRRINPSNSSQRLTLSRHTSMLLLVTLNAFEMMHISQALIGVDTNNTESLLNTLAIFYR